MLGGRYFLGDDSTHLSLFIELKGRVNGYLVSKCKIVNDSEYANFESKLAKWQEALKNTLIFKSNVNTQSSILEAGSIALEIYLTVRGVLTLIENKKLFVN